MSAMGRKRTFSARHRGQGRASPRPYEFIRLVPPERVLRIAALSREREAVTLGGVTRIIQAVLRHECAKRLDLSARIILGASGRALPVWGVVQPRKRTQRIAVADAGARW